MAAARSLHAMSDAALLEGYLAEALAFAGEPHPGPRAPPTRLLPGAGRSAALLHRVRGFALSQLGRGAQAARTAPEASLSEAGAEGSDYEAAVSLQAWRRCRAAPPGSARAAAPTGPASCCAVSRSPCCRARPSKHRRAVARRPEAALDEWRIRGSASPAGRLAWMNLSPVSTFLRAATHGGANAPQSGRSPTYCGSGTPSAFQSNVPWSGQASPPRP